MMQVISLKRTNQGLIAKTVLLLKQSAGLLTVILFWQSSAQAISSNTSSPLKNHPSAYIAMHANDPVHWKLWGPEVMALSKATQKPLFISSGYFACHWCHVMHQENYKDTLVAEIINQNFIAVKIDRELLPDLDDYLLNRLRSATGAAGWPLHAILTPEGHLFSGFVYQPRDTLIHTLLQLSHWWQTGPHEIRALSRPTQDDQVTVINRDELTERINAQLDDVLDYFSGGLNQTQKFPHSPFLLSLLANPILSNDRQDWIITTLEQIQNEHLRDQIYDGFFRYTVDPNWQEPHFEKMLYDNAQLAELFFIAGGQFERKDFIDTAKSTLNYIERELISPTTGLAQSSQSAMDSQGVDGGRYLWSNNQLKDILDSQAFELVDQAWHLGQPAPFELGWLPKQIKHSSWPVIQQTLAIRPSITDDKQLLSWNALLVKSYLQAYVVTKETRYLHSSISLAQRLNHLITLPEPPRAINNQGQLLEIASLEDYSYVIHAFEQLAKHLNDEDWKVKADRLRSKAKQQFFINDQWLTSRQALLPGQNNSIDLIDLATPSTTAIMRCTEKHISLSSHFQPWQYASYLHYQCK